MPTQESKELRLPPGVQAAGLACHAGAGLPARVGKVGGEWADAPCSRGSSHFSAPGGGLTWPSILTTTINNGSNSTDGFKGVLYTPNVILLAGGSPGRSGSVRT